MESVNSSWVYEALPNPSGCTIKDHKGKLKIKAPGYLTFCRYNCDNSTCCLVIEPRLSVFPVAPLFVVQWLFDEEQLRVENIYMGGHTLSEQQWVYIQNLGMELKNSLQVVTYVHQVILTLKSE